MYKVFLNHLRPSSFNDPFSVLLTPSEGSINSIYLWSTYTMGSHKRRLHSPFQYSVAVENSISTQILLCSSVIPKFPLLSFAQGQPSRGHGAILKADLSLPPAVPQMLPSPITVGFLVSPCALLKYCWSSVLNPNLPLGLQKEWAETSLLPLCLDLSASMSETGAPGEGDFRQNHWTGEIRAKAPRHYFGFSLASPRG